MKWLIVSFLSLFPSLVFALSCDLGTESGYTFSHGGELVECSDFHSCSISHWDVAGYENTNIVRTGYSQTIVWSYKEYKRETVYSSGSATILYDALRTLTTTYDSGASGTSKTVSSQSVTVSPACITVSPPPNDCSSKSTTDTFMSIFSGDNSYTLSGCLDGCSIVNSTAEVIARTKTASGITALASYTGGSCSVSTAAPSDSQPLSISASNNGKVFIQDSEAQISFNFPEHPDLSNDVEPVVNVVQPTVSVVDVTSVVDSSGIATDSVIDNNTSNIDDTVYPNLNEYVVVSTDSNGLPVMTTLGVHSGTGGTGGTDEGGTDEGGTGEGDSSIDSGSGAADVDYASLTLSEKIVEQTAENQSLKDDLVEKFNLAKSQFTNLIQISSGSSSCPTYTFSIPFYGLKTISPCDSSLTYVWDLIRGLILFFSAFASVQIIFSRG